MFPISRFRDKGQIVLIFLAAFTIGIYAARNGFLGANTDWMSQHTVFPDYFRRLFYETGNLFPNYAANLGAGQNLYNFSYYGFLSPVILVSYLLPFINMPAYIMAASLISLAAGCLLFYRWLKAKGFSDFISIAASMIFLLATPMFYQTYKQIMFVNYMPFLCLALIGVDRFFRTGKKGMLTVSVFLMIMSSFYFSVSGLFAICLYWLSVYLTGTERFRIGDLLRSGARFLIPILTAVLMAGILLIPTFASLLESHRDSQTGAALHSLFIPQFKLLRYAYSPYGIGLPSIIITVLLAGLFYKKRNERVVAWGMILITVFPVFLFLLNGGLYIEDKALMPFLPIVCWLIALFFQKLEAGEELSHGKLWIAFSGTAVLTLFGIGQTKYWIIVFADALLMLLLYFIYLKRTTIKLFIIPVIAILLVTGFVIQDPGKLVGKEIYGEIFDPDISAAIKEVEHGDPSWHRMDSFLNKDDNMNRIDAEGQYLTSFYSSSFQKDYFDFRNDVFQLERPYRNYLMQPASQDPLFLTFMGVKYVRSDYAPVGYGMYKRKGDVKIYRSENAFPLGYVTNSLLSETELSKYGFPYRQELLLHGTPDFRTEIRPAALALPETKGKGFSITSAGGVYRVKAGALTDRAISLPQPAPEDEVLFLEMNVKNLTPLQDVSLKIQNEQNRLSASDHVYYNGNTVFHFAVSVKKGDTALPATFSAGEYELSSVKSWTLSAAALNIRKDGPYTVTSVGTNGSVISGTVTAPEDGWFITTIPYDKNFRITVDEKTIPFEKVNTAFVGFPISKGFHRIVFHYMSPGFPAGAAASIIGFFLFGLILYAGRRRTIRKLGEQVRSD